MTTTASVYFNKIRIDYPQAGKDNDSQGFRDNFRNIFNAFSATNADIESLKLNSVTLGGANDFGFNVIKKASFQSCNTKLVDYTPTAINGNINIDFNESNYQKFSVTAGASTFFVQNWPATGLSEIRLSVKPNTTATTTINFGGNVTKIGNFTLPVTATSTATQFYDIWSDDGGTSIYVSKKGS